MPLFGKPWTAAPPTPASGIKNHVLPPQKPLIWLGEGSVPEASLAQIARECWRYNQDTNTTDLMEPLATSRQRISLKALQDTTQSFFSSLDQLFFYGSLTRHPLPIPSHRLFATSHHKRSRPLVVLDARSSNINSTISWYDHVTRTIHLRVQRGGGIHKTDLVSLLVHEMVHAYLQIFAAQPEMAASGATEIEDFITESIVPRMRRLKTKKRQKLPCCISSEGGAAATSTASGREMMLRMGTAEGYLSDEPSMWTLETLRAIEAYWDAL
jgi:hypothetical protein